MPSIDWDKRFLEVAAHVSDWSKDPNAKIGAVVVNDRNRVVATGYNGLPRTLLDNTVLLNNGTIKNNMIVHAEQNAVVSAGTMAKDATIYVAGKPTCSKCAGAIIQSGITRIIAPAPKENTASKWDKSGMIALKMFEQAGVEFISDVSIGQQT